MHRKIKYVGLETNEYERFVFVKGNRIVSPFRITQVIKSKEKYGEQFCPIVVVPNGGRTYIILSGQARYMQCREEGKPIMCIVIPSRYRPKTVKEMVDYAKADSTSIPWSLDNYYRSGVALGFPVYLRYEVLVEEFGYGHTAVLSMLAGGSCNTEPLKDEKQLGLLMTEENVESARKFRKIFLEVEKQLGKPLRARTIWPLARVLAAYPKFNVGRFVRNLRDMVVGSLDRGTNAETIEFIEEVYNYKQHIANRVEFKVGRRGSLTVSTLKVD